MIIYLTNNNYLLHGICRGLTNMRQDQVCIASVSPQDVADFGELRVTYKKAGMQASRLLHDMIIALKEKRKRDPDPTVYCDKSGGLL
jgi:hypothetical protein